MFFMTGTSGEFFGTSSDDILVFTSNVDVAEMHGGLGNDLLVGSNECWLYGEGGRDTLIGGSGSSFLDGGAGCYLLVGHGYFTDMIGGPGRDVFEPALGGGALTFIEDFHHGVDRIRVPANARYDRATETLFIGREAIAFVETAGHAAHLTHSDFIFV